MGPPMSSAQPTRAHLDSGPRPLMLPAHNEPQGPRGRGPQPTPCGHPPAPPSCSSPTPRDTARSVPQTLRHQTSCGHRATRGPQVRSRPTSTQPTRGGCFSLTPSLARLLNPDTPAPNFRAPPGQTGQSLSALSCPIRDAPPLPTHQAHQALHPGRVTPCPELPKQASGQGITGGGRQQPQARPTPSPGRASMRALLGWGSTQGTPIPTTSPGAVQVPAWWRRDTKHHPPLQHRRSLHRLRHNWVSDTPAPPRSLSAQWRHTTAPTGAGRSWCPGRSWRPGGQCLGTTLRILLSLGGCEPPTRVPAAPRPSIQHPWEASWWDWTPDSGWTPGQGEGLDVQERPISGRQPHLKRHPTYPGLGHYHRRPRAPLDVGVWRSEASPALSS
ncbi:proline-rich protein HaeIII subfamily 1-like [Delphinapterus leucas]|uniref:Proline-rich protein HaeIII subfamily 1-like n=1 Tax=Delphinapterus leucas TaxID=9749 RepID=A0A2Y9NRT1_DELLE|nr:proline-rich protein HaeIII subfamily 1-like [Delphinapterus leucas]